MSCGNELCRRRQPTLLSAIRCSDAHVHLGQLMVMTKDEKARERVLDKIEGWFANDFPAVRGRVNRLENGPPVGYLLQFRISGSDARKLQPIAEQVAAILAMIPLTSSTFWGPMAWAIMGGLFVATLLTLLFLPALYASWYGAQQPDAANSPSAVKPDHLPTTGKAPAMTLTPDPATA
jgi:multidrug efflux pump subunit AcrB